tara:strand:- start:689 stop:2617 length:1929 start_codon:yes stop_codon:yes gene_type:complete
MENLHIVNLASYNRPQISEDKQREWVNYGDDNNYYQYLIDLYTNSTTNNAIINGIANMIYGKGIDALNNSQKPNEYAAMRSIVSDHCLRKVCLDLKLLGEGSFQVLYQDSKVIKAEHFPRQTLRPEKCNEDGKIEAYYYAPDWTKVKPNDKPKRIASFGFGNGKEPEIKICKRYVSGYDYICPVDYQGGLAYAELESEISDYLINDVQNNFSGTKIVNFNNGSPDVNQQLQIKNDVMRKLTGARGEKVIIAFNNNAESKTTVDDIPLNDAPAHYEYLSNECSNKLIVAHRVTSPLLLGIRNDSNGLGSNADEIKTAALLFDNITIKPYQDLLVDCIDDILAVNDISLKLYFKTLQPLSFIESDNLVTDEAREEETGVKRDLNLKSQVVDKDFAIIDDRLAYATKEMAIEGAKNIGCEGYHEHEYEGKIWFMPCEEHKQSNLSAETDDKVFDLLNEFGEDEDLENWDLVDERKVDYDQEEALDKMVGLARVGQATPNSKSKQDETNKEGVQFRVRYQYAPLTVSSNSREFCRKMVAARKLYRKEDIMQMGKQPVNAGWGPDGAATYDIWLYKGGGSCQHFWMRKTYMSKKIGEKANVPNDEISVNKAKKEGFKPETNDTKVAKRPRDMKNRGFIKPKNFTTPR